MSYMFYRCLSLKKLNIPNFDTNKNPDMRYMFSGCSYQFIMVVKAQCKNIKKEAFND